MEVYMNTLDRIFLLLTALTAFYTIFRLTRTTSNIRRFIFHLISLSVLTLSSLLLMIFGWDILGLMGDGISNKVIAVVASLIPFAWAVGVAGDIKWKLVKYYLPVLGTGLVLITISRFTDSADFARIIYPVFHGFAGLSIIALPPLLIRRTNLKNSYLFVSLGGLLISTGGMALAFLTSGRQLLFFSADVVLMILAPLLLLTTAAYSAGLINSGDIEA